MGARSLDGEGPPAVSLAETGSSVDDQSAPPAPAADGMSDQSASAPAAGGMSDLFEASYGLQMHQADQVKRAEATMYADSLEMLTASFYDKCEAEGLSRFYARFLREGPRRGDGAFEHSSTMNAVRWLEATFPRTQRHRRTVNQAASPAPRQPVPRPGSRAKRGRS